MRDLVLTLSDPRQSANVGSGVLRKAPTYWLTATPPPICSVASSHCIPRTRFPSGASAAKSPRSPQPICGITPPRSFTDRLYHPKLEDLKPDPVRGPLTAESAKSAEVKGTASLRFMRSLRLNPFPFGCGFAALGFNPAAEFGITSAPARPRHRPRAARAPAVAAVRAPVRGSFAARGQFRFRRTGGRP